MKTKKYSQSEILDKYNKLSASKQVSILFDALNYMQEYNGRSRIDCICYAMDYEYISENVWIKEK